MDPSTKERIINHMNKDHQLALADYLVVYAKKAVSTFRPSSVQISDINTEIIKLRFEESNGTIKTIELEWNKVDEPENVVVESASDIKPKLVSMAKHAARKQGYSHLKVKKAVFEFSGMSYFMYGFAAVFTATLVKPDLIRGILTTVGLGENPLLSKWLFVERNIKAIYCTIYGIHLMEALLVMRPMTRRYRMSTETALKWAGMNYIEGFLAILRLKKVVKSLS